MAVAANDLPLFADALFVDHAEIFALDVVTARTSNWEGQSLLCSWMDCAQTVG
jgi:hypothetical protein